MTVVGRGGVGKTAMVCRLLLAARKSTPTTAGSWPSTAWFPASVRARVIRQIFRICFMTSASLYPEAAAKYLDQLYKDPMLAERRLRRCRPCWLNSPMAEPSFSSTTSRMWLTWRPRRYEEKELDEALRALLFEAPPHGLKFLLTTRVAPQALLRIQPGSAGLLSGAGPGAELTLRRECLESHGHRRKPG